MDPDARLARKSSGHQAKLSYGGNDDRDIGLRESMTEADIEIILQGAIPAAQAAIAGSIVFRWTRPGLYSQNSADTDGWSVTKKSCSTPVLLASLVHASSRHCSTSGPL